MKSAGKRTDKFYQSKYNQLQYWASKNGVTFNFSNLDEFKSTWEAMKVSGYDHIYDKLKYNLKYKSQYNTALSVYQQVKTFDESVKLEDIKKMSTKDIYKRWQKEIEAARQWAEDNGMSVKEANKFISTYWFGSP